MSQAAAPASWRLGSPNAHLPTTNNKQLHTNTSNESSVSLKQGKLWLQWNSSETLQSSKPKDSHTEKHRKHFSCVSLISWWRATRCQEGSSQSNFTPWGRRAGEPQWVSCYGHLQPLLQWTPQPSPMLIPADGTARGPHCCRETYPLGPRLLLCPNLWDDATASWHTQDQGYHCSEPRPQSQVTTLSHHH